MPSSIWMSICSTGGRRVRWSTSLAECALRSAALPGQPGKRLFRLPRTDCAKARIRADRIARSDSSFERFWFLLRRVLDRARIHHRAEASSRDSPCWTRRLTIFVGKADSTEGFAGRSRFGAQPFFDLGTELACHRIHGYMPPNRRQHVPTCGLVLVGDFLRG
jgi:hypothetical protein